MAAPNIVAYFMTRLDQPVLEWLGGHRSGPVTSFVTAVTNLGSATFLGLVVAVAAIAVAWRLQTWRPIWISAVTLGGAQLLVFTIKELVARPRPAPAIANVFAGGFSFPSGHTASSLAGYATIAWLICLTTRRSSIRVAAWLSAVLLAVAIGLSRVYLGVHYPTDVIGGWILGATWISTVAVAVSVIHAPTRIANSPSMPSSG